MTFIELIQVINDNRIQISLQGEDLDISAPKGVLNTALLDQLKLFKPELLRIFGSRIPKAKLKESYDLSPAQKRFWILSKFEGGNKAYNIPFYVKVKPIINIEILQQALNILIAKHQILRTVFKEDKSGKIKQFVLDEYQVYDINTYKSSKNYDIIEFILEQNSIEFNLSHFPLFQVALLSTNRDESILHFCFHHIISDEWSIQIFFEQLISVYDNLIFKKASNIQTEPIDYIDYSEWINQQIENESFLEAENYWLKQFKKPVPNLDLQVSRSRPLVKSFRGSSSKIVLDAGVYKKIENFSREQKVSLFTTLLAAVNALLYRYSSQNDIVIGIPVSGRERSETKNLLGLFINTLPIRIQIKSSETFYSIVQKCKKLLQASSQYQDYPFDLLIEKLNFTRDPSRSPLFDIMLTLNDSEEFLEKSESKFEFLEQVTQRTASSQFDIVFRFIKTDGKLALNLEYNTDLFDETYIKKLFCHFENLIKQVSSSPSTLIGKVNYLSKSEMNLILKTFNNKEVPFEINKTIVDLVEDQVRMNADKTAVVYCQKKSIKNSESANIEIKKELTYKQLSLLSNQFSRLLILEYNVIKGDCVGVHLSKSESLLVVLLGILKAGGVYVPIDPEYPEERKTYFTSLTECKVIVDDQILNQFNTNKDKFKNETPNIALSPNDLAHIMFTSGSTGVPKGVMLTHQNIVGLINPCTYMDLDASTILLSTVSVSFDTTNMEFWGVLANGGKIILKDKEYLLNTEVFKETLIENNVDTMFLTSSWFESIVENDLSIFGFIKQFLTGGDMVSYKHINLIRNKFPNLKIIHCYGPTEDTTFSTTYLVEREYSQNIPIGKPIDNGKVYILNDYLVPQPLEVIGTIYLGGIGIARGYFKNIELTKKKFISNPFSPNEFIYNTGDLGRWLPDGNIEIIGRAERQVKIRGKIIDTAEIESKLNRLKGVKQSIVDIQEIKKEKRIIAYLVVSQKIDYEELKRELKNQIPIYMIPFNYIPIPEIPLNQNGKVDRTKLPNFNSLILERKVDVPVSKLELLLVKIWKEILNLTEIGTNENFFELGGHSLLATRVISLIKKEMGKDLQFSELFLNPTISELSKTLENKDKSKVSSSICPEPKTNRIPLSFSQERLWFLDKLQGSSNYHIPFVIRLSGKLNKVFLEDSFKQIIERHHVLRTIIKTENGIPFQKIISTNQWKMEVSFCHNPSDLTFLIDTEISKPFNLSKDYPIRLTLFEMGNNVHQMVIVMHHIVADGWSIPILMRELIACYNSRKLNEEIYLPSLPIQYSDFSIWQRNNFNEALLKKELNFWIKKLDSIEPLNLPLDFRRAKVRTNSGQNLAFKVDSVLTRKLKNFSDLQGATLFMTMLTSLKVLLSKYTGEKDISIGTPIANRTSHEQEHLIGFFVNTLVIRSCWDDSMSFEGLLSKVKGNVLEALDHQNIPFEKIVEKLNLSRDLGQSPIFQVMFTFNNNQVLGNVELIDLEVKEEKFDFGFSKFDLSINVIEKNNEIFINIVYNDSLFLQETVNRFSRHYLKLLEEIVESSDTHLHRIKMLTKEEIEHLTDVGPLNSFEIAEDKTIIDLIETQIANKPHKVALCFSNKKWTYKQLNEKAIRIANHLYLNGLKKGDLVGVDVKNPAWAISAILAVMKLGSCYLPIDLSIPEKRLEFILRDSNLKYLVSDSNNNSIYLLNKVDNVFFLPDEEIIYKDHSKDFNSKYSLNDLVYTIYTSGSTGKPKGVMINNENLLDYFNGLFSATCIDKLETYAMFSTLAADLGYTILYTALLTGSTLHLFAKDHLMDAEWMHDYFAINKIDCFKITPSHWQGLSYERSLVPQKMIIFGGEELSAKIIEQIGTHAEYLKVFNHYGPTETTIGKLIHPVNFRKAYWKVPIGRPFSKSSVYILDVNFRLCPIGVVGEIYIGGLGLSKGYLNQTKLTDEKFILNPYRSKSLLYRTGDMALRNNDNEIIYLGRKDEQVKIRGHRIELYEIKQVIEDYSEVKDVYVGTEVEGDATIKIVSYVVTSENFNKNHFRIYLKSYLTEVMMPSNIVQVSCIPINDNGKVDRNRLRKLNEQNNKNKIISPPRSRAEHDLLIIWRNILGNDKLGVEDNFFEYGVHSLMVTRLISEIVNQFQKEITVREIFLNPTIREVASILENLQKKTSLPRISRSEHGEFTPLSFTQERLWFLDKLQGSNNYHIPIIVNWKGKINSTKLELAFRTLLERHEVLRTSFREHKGSIYQNLQASNSWKLNLKRLDILELDKAIDEEVQKPFDLANDFMVRATIFNLGDKREVLIIVKHHIISDGWSNAIFLKELLVIMNSLTRGIELKLPKLDIQFYDYIFWQRKYISGKFLKDGLSFWENKLNGYEILNFPLDFPRPNFQSKNGSTINYKVSEKLQMNLYRLVYQENVSLFMLLISAFIILINKYTGQKDFNIGTPVANRNQKEVENLIGFFVNTIVIRANLIKGHNFRQLLHQVKETCLGSFENQFVPFEKIVNSVLREVDTTRNPLFDILFSVNNYKVYELNEDEQDQFEYLPYNNRTSQFDINFNVNENRNGLFFDVEYSTDLFRRDTIERFIKHFEHILFAILDDVEIEIDRIDILRNEEKEVILGNKPSKGGVYFNKGLVDLKNDSPINVRFEKIASQYNTRVSIFHNGEEWNYEVLNNYANQIGNTLLEVRVNPGDFVGIYLDRSHEFIGCLLGVLKAGAAYVPLDPQYGVHRVNSIIDSPKINVIISDTKYGSNLDLTKIDKLILINNFSDFFIKNSNLKFCRDRSYISQMSNKNLVNSNKLDSWAYLLFTSGSTGEPKGAILRHDGAMNHILEEYKVMGLSNDFRFLQSANIGSDIAVWQMLGPILIGGTVIIIDKIDLLDFNKVTKLIKQQKINLVEFVPSYLRSLLEYCIRTDNSHLLNELSWIMLTGEQIPVDLVMDVEEALPGIKLMNAYGPCEASDDVVQYVIDSSFLKNKGIVPIGRPISNMNAIIMDQNNKLCPIGIVGELCLTGVGVGVGYLDNVESSKRSFINNPFPDLLGNIMYKTGDLARWLSDGNIEFLGRKDRQIKIRGYRVELGEIESVIRSNNTILDSKTILYNGNLIAFLVPRSELEFTAKEIKKNAKLLCQKALPNYMWPSFYTVLDEIPKNVSEKVDENRLIELFLDEKSESMTTNINDKVISEIEHKLLGIWNNVLDIYPGVDDNFFDLGGHSLLVPKILYGIYEEYEVNLPVVTIFNYPTITELGGYLEAILLGDQIIEDDKDIIEL